MRTAHRHFPGTDSGTSDALAAEVSDDLSAIIAALRQLRQRKSLSLEELGFLLGCDGARLSRQLKGIGSITLSNYLRIARALGYRCRITLEKADSAGGRDDLISNVRISSHKVTNIRSGISE